MCASVCVCDKAIVASVQKRKVAKAVVMPPFQNIQGPTDPYLKHSAVEGYQPVSRIGEVVINAFSAPTTPRTKDSTPLATRPTLVPPPPFFFETVDSFEHSALPQTISCGDVDPTITNADDKNAVFEARPHFHTWATALPGAQRGARGAAPAQRHPPNPSSHRYQA